MRKVAVITGASRGIGKAIAKNFAKNNYDIVLAAKSVENRDILPGTIISVKNEIKRLYPNVSILPVQTNIRSEKSIKSLVNQIKDRFDRVDVLVNNASALYWEQIEDTYTKKYDLIQETNTRGSFLMSKYILPIMKTQGGGDIIMHSPPIDLNKLGGVTAYMISKYGMTMTALGIAQEYKKYNIRANTIWPSTMIESYATINNNLGNRDMWRKPDIIVDSIQHILNEDKNFTGNMLIDEDYLRKKGIQNFDRYRCNPNIEPPKIDDVFEQHYRQRGH